MKPGIKLIAFALLTTCSVMVTAQDTNTASHNIQIDIAEVALLDIESNSGTSIVLAAEAPEEAGLPLDMTNNSNSDLWINYTSVIGSTTEPTREVTVEISSGTVPDGLQLGVEALSFSGAGKGNFGTPVGKVYLTSNPQSLISSVKSAFTGDGPDNGHQLQYTLELNDLDQFGQLDFDQAQAAMSITYTLTDN